MALLRSIGLIVGTLSVVHTAASVPRSAGGSARRISLSSRQNGVPSVPPQCDSTCDPVNSILATGMCAPAECCTPLFQSGYFNCLECVGLADNVTAAEFAQAQQLVDNLTIACSKEGFALPELTLPGQNSARPLATVPITSQSSSRTFSQITVSVPPSAPLSSPAATPTVSQKTVTSLPSQPAAPSPSASSPSASVPPTPTNAARIVGFDSSMLSLMVAAWMMLYM